MLKTRTKATQSRPEPLIPAIPTTYKGVVFRSRLEARWARFLTSLGYKWEYEVKCFSLDSGGYLPDFWLPDISMWAEVKPTVLDDLAQRKLIELTSATGFSSLRLEGYPHYGPVQGYEISLDFSQDLYKGVASKTFILKAL